MHTTNYVFSYGKRQLIEKNPEPMGGRPPLRPLFESASALYYQMPDIAVTVKYITCKTAQTYYKCIHLCTYLHIFMHIFAYMHKVGYKFWCEPRYRACCLKLRQLVSSTYISSTYQLVFGRSQVVSECMCAFSNQVRKTVSSCIYTVPYNATILKI